MHHQETEPVALTDGFGLFYPNDYDASTRWLSFMPLFHVSIDLSTYLSISPSFSFLFLEILPVIFL